GPPRWPPRAAPGGCAGARSTSCAEPRPGPGAGEHRVGPIPDARPPVTRPVTRQDWPHGASGEDRLVTPLIAVTDFVVEPLHEPGRADLTPIEVFAMRNPPWRAVSVTLLFAIGSFFML